MQEVKSCDLCGTQDFAEVMSTYSQPAFVTGRGSLKLNIGVKICKKCGFVFLSPRMDKNELTKYYAAQSRYNKPLRQLETSAYARLCKMQIEFIKKNCMLSSSPILEIGSAEGYFLHCLSLEGYSVAGVEPSKIYKDFCSRNFPSLNVHWTMFEDCELPKEHFSLVVMRHVLEHVECPTSFLKLIRPILRDNGYLYIEVPNLSRAQAAIYNYFHEQHLSYFTTQTIRQLCYVRGFDCQKVEEWDDNPENSGFNYSVLRVIAKKVDKALPSVELSSGYSVSSLVVAEYQRRKELFFAEYIRPLETRIYQWQKEGKRIALFGAGPHTAALLQLLHVSQQTFICAFDNDPLKWGKKISQLTIASPSAVSKYAPDVVIISSREFESEIAAAIESWEVAGIEIVRIYKK